MNERHARSTPRPIPSASPLRLMRAFLFGSALSMALWAAPGAASADDGWGTSHDAALAQGKAENKPVILDLWAEWCVACKDLAKNTFPAPAVAPLFDGFVRAKIDMDDKENAALWGTYKVGSLPQVFFLRPDGTLVPELTLSQFEEPAPFAERLQRARTALGVSTAGGGAAGVAADSATGVAAELDAGEATPANPGDQPNLLGDELDATWQAVQGDGFAPGPQVSVRWVSSATSVAPGESFWVAAHLHVRDGWHIYWKEPGDSGRPTRITPRGEGFSFSDILWPQPYRFEEHGGLVTFGYTNEVVLPLRVTVDEEWTGNDTVPVRADVEWLACSKNCVPGRAEVQTTIHIAERTDSSAHAPALHAAAQRHATGEVKGLPVTTRIHGAEADAIARVVQFELSSVRGGLQMGETRQDAIPVAVWADIPLRISQSEVRVRSEGGKVHVDVPVSLQTGAGGPAEGNVYVVAEVRDSTGLHYLAAEHPVAFAGGAKAEGALPAIEKGNNAFSVPLGPSVSIWEMLLFAFIGGIILNVMPCVLPVLSLKAMSIVKQSGEDPKIIWWHGLAYAAGVLVSFGALALVVVGLKASGELVGWGFQMQNPGFVIALCAIVFGFSLSMFGVYELSAPATDLAHKASARGGIFGSFLNGGFATLLATPCTAPFLGPAMGFAFSQPSVVIVGMFLMVGLGLALPFLLLARMPRLIAKIPRGGAWMDTFKQVMGFLLVATSVWLLDVLSQQISTRALIGVLAFLGVVAVAAWMYGRFAGFAAEPKQRVAVIAAALGLLIGGGMMTLSLQPKPAGGGAEAHELEPGDIDWRPFSPNLIATLQEEGQTVFIDFTAAWCVTCKANESGVIDTDDVKEVMRTLRVVTVKADFTNHDEHIAEWLRRFHRVGVPLYVILPGDRPDEPIVLPELLTEALLIEALEAAGPSRESSEVKGARASR